MAHLLVGGALDVHQERRRIGTPAHQGGILVQTPLKHLGGVLLVTLDGCHADAVLHLVAALGIQLVQLQHVVAQRGVLGNPAGHHQVGVGLVALDGHTNLLVHVMIEEPLQTLEALLQCLLERAGHGNVTLAVHDVKPVDRNSYQSFLLVNILGLNAAPVTLVQHFLLLVVGLSHLPVVVYC